MRKTVNSKGFSSVIGTIFMVLVIMLLSTTVFMWTLRQNTLYYQAVKEKNQIEVDRLNERIKAFNANYAVEDADVSVTVELQNQGPLSVQILNLWVVDVNTGNYNFSKSLSINYLQPGGNATLVATVTIIGSAPDHRFSSWLITGRGNVVPLEEKEEITVADVATGIGSVAMDFSQFRYYEVPNNEPGTDLGSPKHSFTVDGNKLTVFCVRLTNLDPSGQAINLTSGSCIWALTPFGGTVKGNSWSITKVKNNKLATFDFQVLTYNTPTDVYFGACQPGFVKGNVVPVNILLFGKIGDDDYGQNIPFIALYITG